MISLYKGEKPLAIWLKEYFKQNRQMGSGDRRLVSELIYNYFRLGKIQMDVPDNIKILISVFLCNQSFNSLLQHYKPAWHEVISKPLSYKLDLISTDVGIKLNTTEIFPFQQELSKDIDPFLFSTSFLSQPHVFLRVRPGKTKIVEAKLTASGTIFEWINGQCIAVPQQAKINAILKLDEEVVIQDYNSQRTGSLLSGLQLQGKKNTIETWDCCAGSGGKSIMAHDLQKNIRLTVTDIRKEILDNLNERFALAGIKNYSYGVVDVSKQDLFLKDLTSMSAQSQKQNKEDATITSGKQIKVDAKLLFQNQIKVDTTPQSEDPGKPLSTPTSKTFDLIICDVPCTGSGTWSRTPELLNFFNSKDIDKYSALQKQILSKVVPFLAPGGSLLYITCSAFRRENEENMRFIEKELDLKLERHVLLAGYTKNADTMFAALFTAPLV